MKVKVKYYASLREKANLGMEVLEIDNKISLQNLYVSLAKKYQFPYELYEIKFAVNNEYVDDQFVLKENDELVFIPPVAGG